MHFLKQAIVCLVICQFHQYVVAVDNQYQPEQIHLAYGETVRDIVVTWSTKNINMRQNSSIVKYSTIFNDSTVHNYVKSGFYDMLVDEGSKKNTWFIHRVLLNDLKPGRRYEYHVGSSFGWSPTYWFKTPPEDLSSWSPHLAVYGDMGNDNAVSLPMLQEEAMAGVYDAILHVGDFAYNFESEEGTVGDKFMRQIEVIAAYVPYMVCPGNHEESMNFSHYRKRFNMPGPYESLFYSIDIGPMHLISITTEVFYLNRTNLKPVEDKQFAWLEKDLLVANELKNRELRPWVVTMGHRPMYCSNGDDPGFCIDDNLVRKGVTKGQGLEELFYNQTVDLEIWAHEHSYERLWPVYNLTVYNGSRTDPYVNPTAPIHVITGSAGCLENTDNFTVSLPPWSAFRSTDYGFTRMKLFNKTHLRFQQVSINQNGNIIDEWWVIRSFPRLAYPFRQG